MAMKVRAPKPINIIYDTSFNERDTSFWFSKDIDKWIHGRYNLAKKRQRDKYRADKKLDPSKFKTI